jgi:hypothetical protein
LFSEIKRGYTSIVLVPSVYKASSGNKHSFTEDEITQQNRSSSCKKLTKRYTGFELTVVFFLRNPVTFRFADNSAQQQTVALIDELGVHLFRLYQERDQNDHAILAPFIVLSSIHHLYVFFQFFGNTDEKSVSSLPQHQPDFFKSNPFSLLTFVKRV